MEPTSGTAQQNPAPPKPWLIPLPWVFWIIVALIALAVSGVKWFTLDVAQRQMTPRQVVVLTHDLSPFTFIRSEDVALQTVLNPSADVLTDTALAVGRIQVVAQGAGTPLLTSATFPLPAPDWTLVKVAFTDTLPLRSGDSVLVLGVRYGNEAEVVSEDGVIVGHQEQEVIVALPLDQAKRAVRYLIPNHRLILLQRQATGTPTSP
jgi:hypothetical protein